MRQSLLLTIIFAAIVQAGCSQRQLTGVVQSSEAVSGGWKLSLGTDSTADYIYVEQKVLLDVGGMLAVRQNPRNMLLLGTQFVGKKVAVHGEIERDESNSRFIRVSQRNQIELL